MPLSIIVEFEARPGCLEEARALLVEHARLTREGEPGCQRFEVLQPIERDGTPVPDRLMVDELYADEAAVAAHEAGPRMAPLGERLGPLLAGRRLILSRVL